MDWAPPFRPGGLPGGVRARSVIAGHGLPGGLVIRIEGLPVVWASAYPAWRPTWWSPRRDLGKACPVELPA